MKENIMKKKFLEPRGASFSDMLIWGALLAVLAWAIWQLYLHPESLKPRPIDHHPLEDTHP